LGYAEYPYEAETRTVELATAPHFELKLPARMNTAES
jgi:hypothetical protein